MTVLRNSSILSLLLFTILSGCGSMRGGTPAQRADAFLEALLKGDTVALANTTTEKARIFFQESEVDIWQSEDAFSSYEIDETTINRNEAEVHITVNRGGALEKGSVFLRKEKWRWAVYAIGEYNQDGKKTIHSYELLAALVTGIASSVSSGIEEALSQDTQRGKAARDADAERRQFDEARHITDSEYEISWKNSEDFRDKSVLEALQILADRTGYPLYTDVYSDRLAEEVSVDVKGLSVLEAMATLAEQVGLFPLFPVDAADLGYWAIDLMAPVTPENRQTELNRIYHTGFGLIKELRSEDKMKCTLLVEGPRPYPIAFAGPYAVSVMRVSESTQMVTTGQIMIVAQAFGLDCLMFASMANYASEMSRSIENVPFPRITTYDEREVGRELAIFTFARQESSFYGLFLMVLYNLTNDLRALPYIKGTLHVDIPKNVESLVFEPLSKGMRREIDGIYVEVKDISQQRYRDGSDRQHTRVVLTVRGDNISQGELPCYARFWNAQHKEIPIEEVRKQESSFPATPRPETNEQNRSEMGLELEYHLARTPHKLELKVIDEKKRIHYEYQLENTPLTLWGKRPATITPLDFSSHPAPVAVTFESRAKRPDEITHGLEDSHEYYTLITTNHSNKEISKIDLKVVIENKFQVQRNTPLWLRNFTVGGRDSRTIEPGEKGLSDCSIYYHDWDKRVIQDIVITKVEFADLNIWEPQANSDE